MTWQYILSFWGMDQGYGPYTFEMYGSWVWIGGDGSWGYRSRPYILSRRLMDLMAILHQDHASSISPPFSLCLPSAPLARLVKIVVPPLKRRKKKMNPPGVLNEGQRISVLAVLAQKVTHPWSQVKEPRKHNRPMQWFCDTSRFPLKRPKDHPSVGSPHDVCRSSAAKHPIESGPRCSDPNQGCVIERPPRGLQWSSTKRLM